MSPVSRSTVQDFFQAYASRDPARIAPFLDEHVHWVISGPVDVLRFCGERRGKAAVLALFDRPEPREFEVSGFTPEAMLVDGDRAAMLGVLSGFKRDHGRGIRYRLAQFIRFADGKVVEFHTILDSFDAAEQVLGHAIDTAHVGTTSDPVGAGDLVTI